MIAERLVSQGFQILDRNVRLGPLELDIVAQRDELLVICEVRTRSSRRNVAPAATVSQKKLARIRRAASRWIKVRQIGRVSIRFDVAAVTLGIREGEEAHVDYYENVSMPSRWER